MKFKYTATFNNNVTASCKLQDVKKDWHLSKASLSNLKGLIPDDLGLDSNIDLVGVSFPFAVVNQFNKNDDAIMTDTAMHIKDSFYHKPMNVEHYRSEIIGHIVNCAFIDHATNEVLEDVEGREDVFGMALGAVVYKVADNYYVDMIKDIQEGVIQGDSLSTSWEIGFNDYYIGVGGTNLADCEIITEPSRIEAMKHMLKAFGGSGENENGVRVRRIITGEALGLGGGFTMSPAANVMGVYTQNNEEEEVMQEEDSEAKNGLWDNIRKKKKRLGDDYKPAKPGDPDRPSKEAWKKAQSDEITYPHRMWNPENGEYIDVKNEEEHNEYTEKGWVHEDPKEMEGYHKKQKYEEKSSHHDDKPVDTVAMEKKEVEKLIQEALASTSNDHEAVAKSISKIFVEKIAEESDRLLKEQEQEQAEAAEKAQKAETELQDLKAAVEALQTKLDVAEAEKAEVEAQAAFNDRMGEIDEIYSLDEDEKKFVASKVGDLSVEEESFAKFKEELAVILKHKNKEYMKEQEEEKNKEIEAMAKQISESAPSEQKIEDKVTEEEVLEEAVANVEAETVPNSTESVQEKSTFEKLSSLGGSIEIV